MNCPSCAQPFAESTVRGASVLRCEPCALAFLAREEGARLLASLRRSYTPESLAALRQDSKVRFEAAKTAGGPMYLKCPECAQLLGRRVFAQQSGVFMHTCLVHGSIGPPSWVEEAVLFIERGGEVVVMEDELRALREKSKDQDRKLAQAERERERMPRRPGGGREPGPFSF